MFGTNKTTERGKLFLKVSPAARSVNDFRRVSAWHADQKIQEIIYMPGILKLNKMFCVLARNNDKGHNTSSRIICFNIMFN